MHLPTGNFRPVPLQLFELSRSTPDAIALVFADQQMNFKDLVLRAETLAGYLAQRGAVHGGTVAICMERSFDWIVAALGIMQTGSAYVPLDAAWPDERLRLAIADSGANVVVAHTSLLLRLGLDGIDPSRDRASIESCIGLRNVELQPDDLAYVIYTSGSTGFPKGVEIPHENLSALVDWYRVTFNPSPLDRASHSLGLGFDASVLEIWAHLCAGVPLHLAEDSVRSSPLLLQQWILREDITLATFPAVLAAPLMKMNWPETTKLRLLISGGDRLDQCPALGLPFDVVNQYGPTECTVVATWALLEPGSIELPPIGKPVAGARVYLLDEGGEPVDDGDVGEIHIGGAIVGRGYRSRPDQSRHQRFADSFMPDPFASRSGARMYRTGDLAKRRPNGDLEYHGRLDRQIKVRGHRVELDEIGSVLARHRSVEFAAVISTAPAEEPGLTAYILTSSFAPAPTDRELRDHLLLSLPDYMVPNSYRYLSRLPVSANGKIDLNMLSECSDIAPRSPITSDRVLTLTEDRLLGIIRQLLAQQAIAPEDDFFLSGGHSLLGTQLLMRIKLAFGVDLTLKQLFKAPTVERLAVTIETGLIFSIQAMSEQEVVECLED